MSEKLYSGSSLVTDVELEKANRKNRRKRASYIALFLSICLFFLGWWFPFLIGRWPIVIVKGGSGTGEGLILPLTHFIE